MGYRAGSRPTPVIAKSRSAATAGGALAYGLGSTSTFGIYFGSGAPTVSAGKGSLYLRTDGDSTINRIYVNTDGSTAWAPMLAGA